MTKWRGSMEYMEGAEAFVKYAVTNSRNKNSIVCPCKKCGLNRSLRPEEVYDHLTGGRGISIPIPDESRTMQSMLQDDFGMHNILAGDGECQVEMQADYVPEAVDEEIDESATLR